MVICKTLCLSTAHISKATARKIDDGYFDFCLVGKNAFSYTLCSEFDPEDDLPEDLCRVLEYAGSHDCRFVILDIGEDTIPELPTYGW